jgi:hypothetical protein
MNALSGLLAGQTLEAGSDAAAFDDTKKALRRLNAKWRSRLTELRRLGWKTAKGSAWEKHVNCPPPFAYTTQQARHCRASLICPFCWSRMIAADLFDKVEWSIFGSTIKAESEPDPYDIVEIISTEYSTGNKPFQHRLRDLQKSLPHKNHRDVFGTYAVGSFAMITTEPCNGGEDWKFVRRVLAIVEPEFDSDKLPRATSTTHRRRHKFGSYTDPGGATQQECSRETIAAAVGRVCQYPAGLITQPGDKVLTMLRQRQSIRSGEKRPPRLTECYGLLRNGPARRRARSKHAARAEEKAAGVADE